MGDFPSEQSNKMSTSFNGVTDGHLAGSGGSAGERKWKSYKLLIDPILKKGQQKLYRYDGVAPGPSGADFSVTGLRDPRSRLSRFWKGREKYDLPVPKFKYDKYYVGELPPKQVTITNLNDNVRESFLRNMCEKFGTVEDINISFHPKTRKHLGLASVTFSTTRAAKQTVLELNRMSVMGKIIIVQIDAGGTEYERIFECLVNTSTPSSSSSTPRDPRQGLATPDTPTPRSGASDPRRLSSESKTPLGSDNTPMSVPDHQFAFPEPHPVGYPIGTDQGYPMTPGSTTPGLSGNFSAMNMHEFVGTPGNHSGSFPHQDFNQIGMEQYPPHSGSFMPPEHPGMFHDHMSGRQGFPPGFHDHNRTMQFPHQMAQPCDYGMQMPTGFPQGHQNANYNMYQNSQAWDHQNYGHQGTPDNFGYSNQQQDPSMGYANSGQSAQWERPFDSQDSHTDYQHQDQSNYRETSRESPDRGRSQRKKEKVSERRSKSKSRDNRKDSQPSTADDESLVEQAEPVVEQETSIPVKDDEIKPPGTEETEEEEEKEEEEETEESEATDQSEPSMSLDSRIEALLQHQSGLSFGFDLDSSANSGQGDSTNATAAGEFSPSPAPMDGDSPLLDENNRTSTQLQSRSGQSATSYLRYEKQSKHWESPDASKHQSYVDKRMRRLQHSREGSAERFAAEDSCSRDSFASHKSTPEIRDVDKASIIPSGASTPTVSEHADRINIGSLISRGLSNLRNVTDQVPSPAATGSPFVEHQSVNDSLGSTPVESEPQTSRLLGDSHFVQQVQIEITDASRSVKSSRNSPLDMDMDDDRMSMSSLSSGEDTKLEVNIPVTQTNEKSRKMPPLPPPPTPLDLMNPNQSNFRTWPNVSLPGYSGPFSTTSPHYSPGMGYGYSNANPYAAPQSVNMPGYPDTSAASTGPFPNQFMNQWAGMGMTPAQFGQMPNFQHPQMPMMPGMTPFQGQPFNMNQAGFLTPPRSYQDQARMQGLSPGTAQLNSAWHGAMSPAPQFQQFLQQFPQQFQMPSVPNAQSQQGWYASPPKAEPKEELIGELLKTTFFELKTIMKKDLGRKMVEASAFKSLEAWWDDCQLKSKEPVKGSSEVDKPSPRVDPMPLMSISFRSGLWGQRASRGNNLGLESIGLGLGVRATMPRMPSFKVKRKVPEEEEEDKEKKSRSETPQLLDEEASDTEQDKDAKATEKVATRQHRKSVISDEEEEDEEEEEDSEDEEEDEEEEDDEDVEEEDLEEEEEEKGKAKTKARKKVDVEEEGDDEEEEEESDSDYEDEMASLKSGSASSEEESEMSESEESSSGSDVSGSEESESEEETKETGRKDAKAAVDSKRKEKLARIPEEQEDEGADAKTLDADAKTLDDAEKVKVVQKTPSDAKAVNGDVTPKATVKDGIDEKEPKPKATKELLDKTKDVDVNKDTKQSPEKNSETASETKSNKSNRLNSFEMLVELATKARTKIMGEVSETAKKPSVRLEGARESPGRAVDKEVVRVSREGEEAGLVGSESIEEEVVMESVEEMEVEEGVTKDQKAALPKEEADTHQHPLPFLDHSYCQRPPQSPVKDTPPKTPDLTKINQPTLKLIKLDVSDEELAAVGKKTPEKEQIIDVVSEISEKSDAEVTTKKQKPSKRKHTREESSSMEEEVAVPEPSKPQFMPRNYYEEWGLLYQILAGGVDQEDAFYLRKSYASMLQEEQIPWLSYTHWVSHPVTAIPDPPKKKRKVDEVRSHASGAARTEGFYKITTQEKKKYLARLRTWPQEPGDTSEDLTVLSVPVKASGGKHVELSREARSDQRRAMATLMRQDGAVSDLLKFNQLKFRKKDLKFMKSGIHGWGLYAMQPISADEMVIEYVGESIRQSIADERETRYEKTGIGSSYLFRIDADAIIDATKTGNFARFINHSCTPNCYAKIISMESQKKIVIYSKQNISTGEEITYDYKFPLEDEKIPCLCGTVQCRGTLN